MDSSELIVTFAQYIVKRAVGRIRSGKVDNDNNIHRWYCSCCQAKLKMTPLALEEEKENIPHKPDCIYLQAKAVMLIHYEIKGDIS